MTKTLCVFGGSFDPLTKAHFNIIQTLSKKFDKVLVVVNLCTYYRNNYFMFTFNQRKMIIEDVCNRFNLTNVEVSDIEKDLEKHIENHTYSDVIKVINDQYKDYEIFTAIGGDSYKNFKTWRNWQDILKYTKLFVIPRVNMVEYVSDPDVPHILCEVSIQDTGSGTDFRKAIYKQIVNNIIE